MNVIFFVVIISYFEKVAETGGIYTHKKRPAVSDIKTPYLQKKNKLIK